MCAKKTPIAPPAQTPRTSPPPPVVQCCGLRASVALHNWAFTSHSPNALGRTAGSTLIAGWGGASQHAWVLVGVFFAHTGKRKSWHSSGCTRQNPLRRRFCFYILCWPRAAATDYCIYSGRECGRVTRTMLLHAPPRYAHGHPGPRARPGAQKLSQAPTGASRHTRARGLYKVLRRYLDFRVSSPLTKTILGGRATILTNGGTI